MDLLQPSCMSVDACKLCQLRQIVACYIDALLCVDVCLSDCKFTLIEWLTMINQKKTQFLVWVVSWPDNYQIVSHFVFILIAHDLIFNTFLIHDLSENICRWLPLNLFLSGLSALTLMIRLQLCRPLALSYPSMQPDTIVAYAITKIINEIKHLLK